MVPLMQSFGILLLVWLMAKSLFFKPVLKVSLMCFLKLSTLLVSYAAIPELGQKYCKISKASLKSKRSDVFCWLRPNTMLNSACNSSTIMTSYSIEIFSHDWAFGWIGFNALHLKDYQFSLQVFRFSSNHKAFPKVFTFANGTFTGKHKNCLCAGAGNQQFIFNI